MTPFRSFPLPAALQDILSSELLFTVRCDYCGVQDRLSVSIATPVGRWLHGVLRQGVKAVDFPANFGAEVQGLFDAQIRGWRIIVVGEQTYTWCPQCPRNGEGVGKAHSTSLREVERAG